MRNPYKLGLVATVVALAGLTHGVFMLHHTLEFGHVMHRIVDSVAKQAGLQPVTPLNKSRAEPSLAPSTA